MIILSWLVILNQLALSLILEILVNLISLFGDEEEFVSQTLYLVCWISLCEFPYLSELYAHWERTLKNVCTECVRFQGVFARNVFKPMSLITTVKYYRCANGDGVNNGQNG